MKVSIKDFGIGMEIKNTGIELEVRDPSGNQLGDLIVTKTRLIWCRGRTTRDHGQAISWAKFIAMMERRATISR